MRVLLIGSLLTLSLGLGAPAIAASSKGHAIEAPKELGKYRDWTAAIYVQSGKRVCYAFTRAKSSRPSLPGRGPAILTLTQRPASGMSVAMEAGFNYPAKARVTVDVDDRKFDFYTSRHNAFARDSAATVAAFKRGRDAVAHSPSPQGKDVTDTFSLLGFTAAHDAIQKACPGQ